MKRIGLVGARGHTGRELISILNRRTDMTLDFAVSRAMAGEPVSALTEDAPAGLKFEALTPDDIAQCGVDAIILAMPNKEAAPYVEAVETACPQTVLVDLSADYRFDADWTYGLPELYGRKALAGATRISNPGCYATAGQLCVYPVRNQLNGPAHLFGVSGYSGAGTTPSRKNDLAALKDNLMPYALSGHLHEQEMARHLKADICFTPHVAAFFRGLTVTAQLSFTTPMDPAGLRSAFHEAYAHEKLIQISEQIPEITDGANTAGAVIGGFSLSEDGMRGVVVCALDNLLKGAAVQAVQNLALAMGLDEFEGILG